MSYETTMARGEARARDQQWREHYTFCPECSRAARVRRWTELCHIGSLLRAAKQAADAELRKNIRLDKEPIPSRGVLIEREELA